MSRSLTRHEHATAHTARVLLTLGVCIAALPAGATTYMLAPGRGVKIVVTVLSDTGKNMTVDNYGINNADTPQTWSLEVPDGTTIDVEAWVYGIGCADGPDCPEPYGYSNKARILLKQGSGGRMNWKLVDPQPPGYFTGIVGTPDAKSDPNSIGFGQGVVPYNQEADWPALTGSDLDVMSFGFLGSQIQTRRSFGYGMYVATMMPDVEIAPFVTGLFTFVIQPSLRNSWTIDEKVVNCEEWNKAALWRWSEVDWEFVPRTFNVQREHTVCTQPFPNGACQDIRSDFLSEMAHRRFAKTDGTATDDLIAQSVAINSGHPGKYPTFDDLVQDTGPGKTLESGSLWGFPAGMGLPTRDEMEHSVALNVFRMPNGSYLRHGTYEASPACTFDAPDRIVPRIPVSKLQAHKDDLGARQNPDGILWAFAVTNELYVLNRSFNPYTSYHTYTIVQAPDGIAFYVDAPAGGTDLSNATPAKVFKNADYPSLEGFGPKMPGGAARWRPVTAGGQEPMPAANDDFTVGNSTFMANMWWSNSWSGFPARNSKYEFVSTTGTSYLRTMAFYPLTNTRADITKLKTTDFTVQCSSKSAFCADFTSWTPEGWWFDLRRDFLVVDKSTGDGTSSVLTVARAADPKNTAGSALQLRITNHPAYPHLPADYQRPGWLDQSLFNLVPQGEWADSAQTTLKVQTQATVTDYDDVSKIWSQATYPRWDSFRLDNAASTAKVWLHVTSLQSGRSDAVAMDLTNDGYEVIEGDDKGLIASSGSRQKQTGGKHPSGLWVVRLGPNALSTPTTPQSLRWGEIHAVGWLTRNGDEITDATVKVSWYNNVPEPDGSWYYAWVLNSSPADYSGVVQVNEDSPRIDRSVTWSSPTIKSKGIDNQGLFVYVNSTSSTTGGVVNAGGPNGAIVPIIWGVPRVSKVSVTPARQGATVTGTINPYGSPTRYTVKYGTDTTLGRATAMSDAISGNADKAVSVQLSGLTPGTTYYAQLLASSTVGSDLGEIIRFTTTGQAPAFAAGSSSRPWAITGGVKEVQASAATLTAAVNPNGADTTYYFEYGETASYGFTTETHGPLSHEGVAGVSVRAYFLEAGTTYHYRAVASNGFGSNLGNDRVFTTLPSPSEAPAVSSVDASDETCTSVVLLGSVTPRGEPTAAWFDYGPTLTLGHMTEVLELDPSASPRPVSARVPRLPGHNGNLFFRLVAWSTAGFTAGRTIELGPCSEPTRPLTPLP